MAASSIPDAAVVASSRPLVLSDVRINYLTEPRHEEELRRVLTDPDQPLDRSSVDHLLLQAASKGSLKALRLLLETQADPNIDLEFHRQSPLSLACQEGRLEHVRALLEAKAHPDALDSRGATALRHVISSRQPNLQVIEALLQAGADPDQFSRRDPDEEPTKFLPTETPLMLALAQPTTDFAVAELLLRHGADINFAPVDAVTPLLAAILRHQPAATVRWLLEKGSMLRRYVLSEDIDDPRDPLEFWCMEQWPALCSPLMVAARSGHPTAVLALLAARASPMVDFQPGPFGHQVARRCSALSWAAENRRVDTVTPLLRILQNVDVEHPSRGSPLFTLLKYGRLPQIELLLDAGCLVQVEHPLTGELPLEWLTKHHERFRFLSDAEFQRVQNMLLQTTPRIQMEYRRRYIDWHAQKIAELAGWQASAPSGRIAGLIAEALVGPSPPPLRAPNGQELILRARSPQSVYLYQPQAVRGARSTASQIGRAAHLPSKAAGASTKGVAAAAAPRAAPRISAAAAAAALADANQKAAAVAAAANAAAAEEAAAEIGPQHATTASADAVKADADADSRAAGSRKSRKPKKKDKPKPVSKEIEEDDDFSDMHSQAQREMDELERKKQADGVLEEQQPKKKRTLSQLKELTDARKKIFDARNKYPWLRSLAPDADPEPKAADIPSNVKLEYLSLIRGVYELLPEDSPDRKRILYEVEELELQVGSQGPPLAAFTEQRLWTELEELEGIQDQLRSNPDPKLRERSSRRCLRLQGSVGQPPELLEDVDEGLIAQLRLTLLSDGFMEWQPPSSPLDLEQLMDLSRQELIQDSFLAPSHAAGQRLYNPMQQPRQGPPLRDVDDVKDFLGSSPWMR